MFASFRIYGSASVPALDDTTAQSKPGTCILLSSINSSRQAVFSMLVKCMKLKTDMQDM